MLSIVEVLDARWRAQRHSGGVIGGGLLAVDALVVVASTMISIIARNTLPWFEPSLDVPVNVAGMAGLVFALWLASLAAAGSYRSRHVGAGTAEYRAVLRGSLMAAALVGISAYLLQYPLSRGFFVLVFGLGTPLLLLVRVIVRRMLKAMRTRGLLQTPVLVAGSVAHIDDLTAILHREAWLGYQVLGALPSDGSGPLTPDGLPVLGSPEDVADALERTGARGIIFAEGSFPRAHLFNATARTLEEHNAQMIVVPALTDVSAERLDIKPVAGIPLVHIERTRAQFAGRWAKRLFDIVGASLALLVFSPVFLVVALTVRLHDGGPVVFRQVRVGRQGRLFSCLKFRTMSVNAPDRLRDIQHTNHGAGPLFKQRRDPRITRVGRFLRRSSLDELPQLINVLRGEMSLVGPRPALPSEVDRYEEHVLRRLDVRPGITGLWQVSGRSDLSWEETVRLDLYYVDNWSILQDLNILGRTLGAVVRGRGAY